MTKWASVPLFGLLILTQAAHSLEEYAGRLYDVFPPARVVSGLFTLDLRLGFILFNVARARARVAATGKAARSSVLTKENIR